MLRRKILLFAFPVAIILTHLLIGTRVSLQSNLRRLTVTNVHALNLNPTISDDGTVVAFESNADLTGTGVLTSFHALAVKDPASSPGFVEFGLTRLACPGVSNEGASIVFASNEDLVGDNADRNSEIFLYRQSRIEQFTHTASDGFESRLTEGSFRPEITNDGKLVTFWSNRDLAHLNPTKIPAVFVANLELGSLVRITDNEEAFLSNPKVSGDGSRIVFLRTDLSGTQTDLLEYEMKSRNTRVLAGNLVHPKFANARALSDDGKRIVFSADTGINQTQVFLIDESEQGPRQLTSLGSRTTDVPLNPTISGDGKRIAFATRRRVINQSDGSVELYVLDLPTGETYQITNAPAAATAEVVSSMNVDGSLLVFNFPRILSDVISDEDFANNSEIYLSEVPSRPAFGTAEAFNAALASQAVAQPARVAPESIVNVRGKALAFLTREATLSTDGEFPGELGGTRVTVAGLSAQIAFVSPTELAAVLPKGLVDGLSEIVITNRDGFQSTAHIVIENTAPGLFSLNGSAHVGVILDADKLLPAPFDPSGGSLRLNIYATGIRNAHSLSARVNGESLSVDTFGRSNVPGLDEIHLLLPPSMRGAGNVQLSVVADGAESNKVTLSVSGSPVRDLLINEFLVDPPDGIAGDANHDGVRSASADEFVELVNTTSRDIDLENYRLLTRNTEGIQVERHKFTAGSISAAGTALVIFGAGNPNVTDPIFAGASVFKSSSGALSLTNSGGAIILKDPSGAVISSVSYGAELGLAADINQSLTRSPDITGNFVPFKSASGSEAQLFSPGTHVDGSPFPPTPAVSQIVLLSTARELLVGSELQLRASALDANNREMSGIIIKWHNSAPTIASVDSVGLVKGLKSGTAEISASARGVTSAPLQLQVVVPPPTPTPTPAPTPSPSPTPQPSTSPSPSPLSSPSPTVSPSPSPQTQSTVLISQIFGGGGNSGAPFRNDFIELFNAGTTTVNLSGWSVQYASATASTWSVTSLTSVNLAPGQHYLIQESSGGSSGVQLPTPDATGTIALAATAGKVALLRTTTSLAGSCPTDPNIVDFVGYGTTASCFRGTAPAPAPSNTNAVLRGANGCANNQTNSMDFIVGPPNPKHTGSAASPCQPGVAAVEEMFLLMLSGWDQATFARMRVGCARVNSQMKSSLTNALPSPAAVAHPP